MSRHTGIAIALMLAIWPAVVSGTISRAAAKDLSTVYPRSVLEKDRKRLETAVRKLFRIGLEPSLNAKEKKALSHVQFHFPYPRPKDYPLNFYAFAKDGRAVVVMPVLSLKMLEDLTTAYAWLHENGYSLSTIDLYFAMLRHRAKADFPGRKYLPPLQALGIPANALDDPKVDANSLSFRNEAFAFILLHELGHVLFKHKGYDEITKAQARADEVQSDRFALDVLGRTGTPPLGAVFFFQAQFYSLPHRGLFKSEAAWEKYMNKAATHPLTGDRLSELARYVDGTLAESRPK